MTRLVSKSQRSFVRSHTTQTPPLLTAAFSNSLHSWRIDEEANLQKSIIFSRFVPYFDTSEVQSKRHVKSFFVFCTGVCLHVCVCSYPTVWRRKEKKKKKALPLKAILSFWSVWWNLWRGTARGLFCFWAVGEAAFQTIKPRLSYIRQEGREDTRGFGRQLCLFQRVPSKQLCDAR